LKSAASINGGIEMFGLPVRIKGMQRRCGACTNGTMQSRM
jgi:hypothetical protein